MSNTVYQHNGVLCFMVRKTIITCLIVILIYSCSNKERTFAREKDVLKVLEEINHADDEAFIFLIIRTTRCDLCTDAARQIFNESKSKIVLLIDSQDSSFIKTEHYKNKSVIVKPSIYFESRGIDFGENYMFVVKDSKVISFSSVSKETKSEILEIISSEFN